MSRRLGAKVDAGSLNQSAGGADPLLTRSDGVPHSAKLGAEEGKMKNLKLYAIVSAALFTLLFLAIYYDAAVWIGALVWGVTAGWIFGFKPPQLPHFTVSRSKYWSVFLAVCIRRLGYCGLLQAACSPLDYSGRRIFVDVLLQAAPAPQACPQK